MFKANGKKTIKEHGKCFFYGKKGHWKKKCLVSIKKKSGMHHYLLVELSLVVDSTNSWLIDLRGTNHVYNSLQRFQLMRRLNTEDMYLTLATEARVVMQIDIHYLYLRLELSSRNKILSLCF